MNYEERLEKAKRLYEIANADQRYVLESLFPELKESEDERIRKIIIKFFKGHYPNEIRIYDTSVTVGDAIAWLEKQGEKKPIIDGILTATKYDKMFQNCKVHKFNVGDWVVQEKIGIYKVIEVCESWYEVIDVEDNHYSIAFDKEYMCHLWTIQDAKNGDVLFDGSNILLVKEINNWHNITSYLAYSQVYGIREYLISGSDVITPSTKEQRDLLFEKIHEAGYEWDAEKKELKK